MRCLLFLLISISATVAWPIDSVLARAKRAEEIRWTPTAQNTDLWFYTTYGNSCTGESAIYKECDFIAGQEYRSVAYSYGGEDSDALLASKIERNFLIGSHLCHYRAYGDPSDTVAGTDCSGFVSWCWSAPRLSTGMFLSSSAYEKVDRNALQRGDALVKAGSHMVLVLDATTSDAVLIVESTSAVNGVRQRFIDVNSEYVTGFGAVFALWLDSKFIIPDVYAYDDDLTEKQLSLFVHYKQSLIDQILFSVNVRQQFVTGYSAPFTPAFGAEFKVVDKGFFQLSFLANYSMGYKVPTLNQRFWGEVGNPDILSEESKSYDFTIRSDIKSLNKQLKFNLTFYSLEVDNLILWLNTGNGIYKPKNRDNVHNLGVETSCEFLYKYSDWRFKYNGSLNYLKVENKIDEVVYDFIEYTPTFSYSNGLLVQYNQYYLNCKQSYSGKFYNALNKQYTLGMYSIVDLSFGLHLYKNNWMSSSVSFSANNLFDEEYKSKYAYAMPGRNYNISLNINF